MLLVTSLLLFDVGHGFCFGGLLRSVQLKNISTRDALNTYYYYLAFGGRPRPRPVAFAAVAFLAAGEAALPPFAGRPRPFFAPFSAFEVGDEAVGAAGAGDVASLVFFGGEGAGEDDELARFLV